MRTFQCLPILPKLQQYLCESVLLYLKMMFSCVHLPSVDLETAN